MAYVIYADELLKGRMEESMLKERTLDFNEQDSRRPSYKCSSHLCGCAQKGRR